jgi:hypothetical protein
MRLVYICDWLPPDFGAVGQYAMISVREWAKNGWHVTLVGLTSGNGCREAPVCIGDGSLEIIRIHRPTYEKCRLRDRLVWTIVSNLLLLKAAFGSMRCADAVLFTGSPPLMLHFIVPLNLLTRTKLIYRITDFHPECLIAERGRAAFLLTILLRLTHFWRRRIDKFEVLGWDQARRLAEARVPSGRIVLKRDPSPVAFSPRPIPARLPNALRGGAGVILYSGNWGIAHDDQTFIESYCEYCRQSSNGLRFWLNAVGSKADCVEGELRRRGAFVYRSPPVCLSQLAPLLLAADVHLITLRDAFVGYVLPSKVHACIGSGKRVLFIGSERSDVHYLAKDVQRPAYYRRVDVGDVDGLLNVLHALEAELIRERTSPPFVSRPAGPDLGRARAK